MVSNDNIGLTYHQNNLTTPSLKLVPHLFQSFTDEATVPGAKPAQLWNERKMFCNTINQSTFLGTQVELVISGIIKNPGHGTDKKLIILWALS